MENNKHSIKIPGSIYFFLSLVIISFAALFFWAKTYTLDVLSIADGKVTPQGEIKSIQHLEGGIVDDILVQPGDIVKKGDSLLVLESISSGADFGEVAVRLSFLEVEKRRLRAEINLKTDLKIPKEFLISNADMVNNSKSLHRTIMQKYKSQIVGFNEITKQKKSELHETRVHVKNLKKNLAILNKQIAISNELLKEELTSEYVHYDLLRKQIEIQTQVDKYSNNIHSIKSTIAVAQENLNTFLHTFIEETKEQLKIVTQELEQLTKRQNKFQDSLARTVIKSPVDGTIKSLKVYTKGGVIKAGDTVVRIVPSDDQLIVEALMRPQDIGYVQVGQYAFIRLNSIDAMKFDKLDGKVVFVSPDTFSDESGDSFYKVHIETKQNYFNSKGLKGYLVPGMEVVSHIHIGSRTVLDYLIAPFKSSIDIALSEK